MTILKQAQQREVGLQRPMPVVDVNKASKIKEVSAETVQLYYLNSGVITTDAGQAAGTIVYGKLAYTDVLSAMADVLGSAKNSSLTFANANTFDSEVVFPYTKAELFDVDTPAVKIAAIAEVLTTNGQYCVDYRNGIIYGKKKNTGTTVAATYKSAVMLSDITLSASDIQIGAVEIKDGATDTRTKVGVASTILPTDNAIAVADPTNLPCSMQAEFASPYDFTATYTSNVTITITGAPFTVDDANCTIVGIMYKPTAGSWTRLDNVKNGVSISASSNVITVSGAGTPFASGDIYRVSINYQKKGYDKSTDSEKVTVLNPDSNKYVLDSLVDTTNATGTNYYPSSTGMAMDGFRDLFLTGKLIDADATTTMTLEATNDEDLASADWVQIYGWDDFANAAANSIAAASTTKTFAWAFEKLGYSSFRVKVVCGDSTNTLIIKARRLA